MRNKIHIPAHGPAPRRALLLTFAIGAALAVAACGTVLEPIPEPTGAPASRPDISASTVPLAATVVSAPDRDAPPDTPTPAPPADPEPAANPVPTNTPGPTPTALAPYVPTDPVTPPEDPTPTPTSSPTSTPEPVVDVIPSGALALFYRTSFSSDTEVLNTVSVSTLDPLDTDVNRITWDTSSKGIIRYIPSLDRYDVMKTIRSTSFSKSSIYPITANGKLYIVRDWGSDWNGENTRFDIDEMDPVTGVTLSGNTFHGEWFAIAEDRIYFKSEVKYDLFGNPSGGGRLMMQELGSFETEELANKAEFFRAVEDGLISFTSDEVRLHDTTTGAPTAIAPMGPGLVDDIWPYAQQVFTGDSAIYWAIQNAPLTADILSLGPDGEVYHVVGIDFDPEEVGITVDEHDGLVLVGGIAPSHSKGLAVTSAFVIDTATGESEEIPINTFIPSARAAAGGGLQLLILP